MFWQNTGNVVLLLVRNDCCKNFSNLMKEEIYQEPQCFENQWETEKMSS